MGRLEAWPGRACEAQRRDRGAATVDEKIRTLAGRIARLEAAVRSGAGPLPLIIDRGQDRIVRTIFAGRGRPLCSCFDGLSQQGNLIKYQRVAGCLPAAEVAAIGARSYNTIAGRGGHRANRVRCRF